MRLSGFVPCYYLSNPWDLPLYLLVVSVVIFGHCRGQCHQDVQNQYTREVSRNTDTLLPFTTHFHN
jgi:hypothetical protein